jgi:TPR repeat protein
MKRLIFMTIPKYLFPFLFVTCVLSALCGESNQVDESSQSFPSPGKLLQKAYLKDAEAGSATAQCELGFLYSSGRNGAEQNFDKAREWLTKSAEQDYSEAQMLLGTLYHDGIGTNKNSSEGFRWLLKSAEQKQAGKNFNLTSNELAAAYSCLGKDFQTGEGVKQDLDKAFSYYFKAAELGDAEAQVLVGSFYSLGISVKEDQKESVRWYEKAAKQGDVTGLCALGECYKEGKGVPQNFVEAYKWYSLAVAVGNVSADSPITMDTILPLNALKMRDELAKQMTPEQLADAQKRTEKFWSDMKK